MWLLGLAEFSLVGSEEGVELDGAVSIARLLGFKVTKLDPLLQTILSSSELVWTLIGVGAGWT